MQKMHREQRAHQAPQSPPQRNQNGLQKEPPQNPDKDDGDVAVAHGTAPQAAENKQIKDHEIGQQKPELKTAKLHQSFQPRECFQEINPLETTRAGRIFEPEPHTCCQYHPYGQRNEKMVRGVGSHDQLSGHKWMQIAAGFGAAIDKFAGSGGHKFDRRYQITVPFQVAFFLL